MKIAVVSESSADEAAIRILVDAIVGLESSVFSLRTRPHGWTKMFDLLPNIVSGLYYHSDVEGLVVVMDSDESPPHEVSHEEPNEPNPECRLCQLRVIVRRSLDRLQSLATRPDLKIALGLAVPAIEAWYRAGIDPHVYEVAWSRKLLLGENVSYDKRSLKKDAYGSAQPSVERRTNAAVLSAHRLAGNLELLKQLFPDGFGSLLRDLQSW